MATLSSLVVNLQANTAQYQRGMRGASRSLGGFQRQVLSLKRLVAGAGIFIGARSLVRGIGSAIKEASTFEAEMVKLITLVGLSEQAVEGFTSSVRALAVETGKPPVELAKALFVITSAGARGAEALSVLEQTAKASAAGLGETAVIARTVVQGMTAFAKSGLSAAKATDILVATVRAGNLEAADLATSIGKVLGPATAVGANFADLNAFVATFTRVSGSAAEGATALNGIFKAFLAPTEQGAEAMKKFGINAAEMRRQIREEGLARTLVDLAKAVEGNEEALVKVIPEFRSFSGFMATAALQGEEFIRISDEITRAQGDTGVAFARTTETAQFAFRQLGATARVLAGLIGEAILPSIQRWTVALQGLVAGQGGFTQTAVRNIGVIIERMGDAIVFVSSHPIMAQGGLVGLLMFGGRGAAVMAAVGTALDELRIAVFGSTTEFGKSAERVARLEDELLRAEAAIVQFNRQVAAGNPLSVAQQKTLDAAKTKVVSLTIELRNAEQTLDDYKERIIDSTGVMGKFGEGIQGMGQDLQGFTLNTTASAAALKAAMEALRQIFKLPPIEPPEGLGDLPKTLREAGEDAGRSFIRGIINGMSSLSDLLVSAIKSIAEFLIIREFNTALGNKSPSKFAALAGRNTVLGYIKGLQDAATAIPSAVGGAFALAGAPAGAGAGGGTIVHQEINFHFHAAEQRGMRQLIQEQSGTILEIVGDAAQAGRGFRRVLRGR